MFIRLVEQAGEAGESEREREKRRERMQLILLNQDAPVREREKRECVLYVTCLCVCVCYVWPFDLARDLDSFDRRYQAKKPAQFILVSPNPRALSPFSCSF